MLETDSLRHTDSLFRYAMALARNPQDAEDLVQETYARALKAAVTPALRGDIKKWLFAILRNVWLNELRRRRVAPNSVEFDLDEIPSGNGTTSEQPHDAYVSSMEQILLREAIQKLPVVFREIVILREFEDLSYEEVATLLGCPPGTVMSRLARARAKLRSLLSAAYRSHPVGEKRREATSSFHSNGPKSCCTDAN